jgi:cysteine synthase A
MSSTIATKITDLIGNTPVIRIASLSELTGSDILIKCEAFNPGGSIKDRAALQMVKDAMEAGQLKPGMTIVEGTAGNTGIGLAIVAKAFGLNMLAVMPKGQAAEKERMLELFGAELKLVDPCPFANEKHFYHTARRIAEEDPQNYWWANQFENLSNYRAHFLNTGPEIVQQTDGKLDFFISAAGTGGTIGGNSAYLKEHIPGIECFLVDPAGSGLCSYVTNGEFKSEGSSITEGIGIMRLVENFKQAKVDGAFSLPDQDIITVSQYVRDHDGILLGSSSALNVAGALRLAVQNPGKRILTFMCDLGERSYSKMFNPQFLQSKGLDITKNDVRELIDKYQTL